MKLEAYGKFLNGHGSMHVKEYFFLIIFSFFGPNGH